MSVASRQYEFEAGTQREFSPVDDYQPQNLEEATEHVLSAGLAEVDSWESNKDMRKSAAAEIALELYEEGKDFGLQLALYEHGSREPERQLCTDNLVAAVLRHKQERRSPDTSRVSKLAVSMVTDLQSGEQTMLIRESDRTTGRVVINQ